MTIAEIKSAMDAIVFGATNENRTLTDDETTAYEAKEVELQAAQKSEEITRRHAVYSAPVIDGFPATIKATPKGEAAETYAFNQYLRTGLPNADLTFAQTEGSSAGGGYAVPDAQFLNRFTEKRTAFGGLMNAAENVTTPTGAPLQWPSVIAAVSTAADIAAEGATTAVGADIVFAEVTLGAYRYIATGASNLPLKVSVELLQDASFDIGAFVAKRLAERIARKQAYDLCNGSGTNEPQGIAYGTAGTIEHDPDGFAAFSNLVHALDPEYRTGAKWIMNDTTLKGIEQLLDGPSGTSGRPLIVTSTNGIENASSNSSLLGYPIIIDQAMPTWAADDVIGAAFGKWDEAYIVRHVRDVQVLVNPYEAVGYVTYHAWARMDGKVQNSAAYVTGEGT